MTGYNIYIAYMELQKNKIYMKSKGMQQDPIDHLVQTLS